MARQIIDIGTIANDGTGDPLRDAMDKVNDNEEQLYGVSGWAYYEDAATTPATQTFNTTPSKLQIDGAGANSTSAYLPREIRGTAELWDTTTDKITPVNIGDAYTVRVTLNVTAKSGSPNNITLALDIGGGATPTIIISSIDASAGKSAPFTTTFSLPLFSLNTFLTNGGQLFISTDSGSVTVGGRNLYIKRDMNGLL